MQMLVITILWPPSMTAHVQHWMNVACAAEQDCQEVFVTVTVIFLMNVVFAGVTALLKVPVIVTETLRM
jgi:hypothetical protein